MVNKPNLDAELMWMCSGCLGYGQSSHFSPWRRPHKTTIWQIYSQFLSEKTKIMSTVGKQRLYIYQSTDYWGLCLWFIKYMGIRNILFVLSSSHQVCFECPASNTFTESMAFSDASSHTPWYKFSHRRLLDEILHYLKVMDSDSKLRPLK